MFLAKMKRANEAPDKAELENRERGYMTETTPR